MKKLKLFLVAMATLVTALAYGQDITVKGVVSDATNGDAVPFAAIQLKGTSTGTSTDADGQYVIKVPSNGTLVFTSVGYETKEVAIDGQTTINVSLSSDAEYLDDVIVVAYGTAKKSSFTGSAGTVKSDNLKKRTVANVSKAIEGFVAGVTTTSGSGQPGEGASIQIRGTGSINASSNPLYVVDGIPYDGNLASINPNDIESLTILKDASAAALYGSRGANGVVMITTKKGAEGRTVVNFRANVGLQSRSIRDYDMVSQKEFVELTWEALKNNYFQSGYSMDLAKQYASADMSGALGGEQYNPYKNYTWGTVVDPETGLVRSDAVAAWDESWMDELTNTKAVHQEYNLGVSGGDAKTKYAFSFGYLDEQGVLITTKFNRFSIRGNVDHQAKNWLSMGANVSYSKTDANQSQYSDTQTGNAWYTAQFMAPIYPVYMKDESGKDILDEEGNRMFDYGMTGRPKASRFNAVGDLYDNQYNTKRDNTSARGYVTLGGTSKSLGAFQGLTFTVNVGADLVNRYITSYYNPYHGDGSSTQGSVDKYSTRTFSYTVNEILKYDRKFGDHHVLAQAGHEYYNYDYSYLYASRDHIYAGITELAPASGTQTNNSYSQVYRIESYLGRLNYDYADKYYVEATFRTDGSSRFNKDYRWGKFWSLGGSWRISEENFMKNVSWVDNATIRASYGQLGNDTVGSYYAWQSLYDLTYANANNSGAIVSTLENRSLSWEKRKTWNFGVEGSFFKKFLDVTLEYYLSKTDDLLLSAPMAASTGFTGYNSNLGSMRNNGFESTFKFNWLQKSNLRASSTLMAYLNRNKVLHLTGDSDTITSGAYVIKEGMPIYTYYVPKAAGVDPATGALLYWAYKTNEDTGEKIEGSDYITSDKSKATNSKYYMGSRQPKLMGSFGSDFQFGAVDFSFLTTFSVGGKVYDSVYASAMEVTYSGDTWSKNALRRWQNPGDKTDVPAVLIGSGRIAADRWLVDASYFAIKSVQLGYTFPGKWTKKVNIDSFRIFLNGDNLALFSHLNGLNPQYNISGGTNWSYTPTRTVSAGIDINF